MNKKEFEKIIKECIIDSIKTFLHDDQTIDVYIDDRLDDGREYTEEERNALDSFYSNGTYKEIVEKIIKKILDKLNKI